MSVETESMREEEEEEEGECVWCCSSIGLESHPME